MTFGIITERKNPPDRRVVFTPEALLKLQAQYPDAQVLVEQSGIRVFPDQAYVDAGFKVVADVSSCDVLFGVKEIPVDDLIPNKKYFFFSHTIKKQPHNQKLLAAILEKHIDLYDHETIVDAQHKRLIGFGRYAGIVGAYNGIRAFGIKFELFTLPKAESLEGKEALVARMRRLVMPPVKIVLTGRGKVGMGAKEMLDAMKIKEVDVADFLSKNYSEPVYAHIDILDYNRRKDGAPGSRQDFYDNPADYESDFGRFSEVADIFMAGHFHATESPDILTRGMLRAPQNNIRVVADMSCDVDGPIACTIRASTIAEPFYGYIPETGEEADMHHPGAIVVMAVDNLPCELPRDASEGFGEMFLKHVIPAFFNGDRDGILARAQVTHDGNLTPRFAYLADYAAGKVSV